MGPGPPRAASQTKGRRSVTPSTSQPCLGSGGDPKKGLFSPNSPFWRRPRPSRRCHGGGRAGPGPAGARGAGGGCGARRCRAGTGGAAGPGAAGGYGDEDGDGDWDGDGKQPLYRGSSSVAGGSGGSVPCLPPALAFVAGRR